MTRIRSAILVALALCGAAGAADAAVFVVNNTNDSGPGSLRQAILDSNRAPGPNVIEIDLPAGETPNVISPVGQFLPPIKGPVIVRVKGTEPVPPPPPAPGGRGGRGGRGGTPPKPIVILDGSNLVKPGTPDACPRESVTGAGLAVHDSDNVEIYGLEIRNFCIGIAVVRSHDVILHDLKISDSQGPAGVIFAAGTHDSVLQGTTISLTQPSPANGNAVQLASGGDRNALMGNTFTKYADTAVTVGGADQTIRDNRFLANEGAGLRASGANLLIIGNTFSNNGGDAMSVSGAGSRVMDNLVSGNRGKGIVVGGTGVTLSRNSIFDNAHPGIDAGGSDAPVMASTSKWSADGLVINGSLTGTPGERYAVEIFLSRAADRHEGDEKGWGEGQCYIGTASATPNASGKATFTLMVKIADIFGDGQASGFVSATARDAAGSTSRFSRSLPLDRK
jgi:3-dehydroshikimate dehydratase